MRNRVVKLASMGRDELLSRARQAGMARWDAARRHFGGVPWPRLSAAEIDPAPSFFFTAEDVPELVRRLDERLPSIVEALVMRAERICAHRFDLLGYEDLELGQRIDWHRDAVSGTVAPRRAWYKVPFLDYASCGDAKVTWELNRHQHWVALAKAYRLTGEARFVDEIRAQWESWWAANPYPLGINWASALEVAFRSVSWLWVDRLLAGSPAHDEGFSSRLHQGLALNGRHLELYLSTYFSPNTHLLGEAFALFLIGLMVPQAPAGARWRRQGWELIVEQAARQVRPDGLHFERSAYYHVYALDFFLHARILAERNGISGTDRLDATIGRQLDVLLALGKSGAVFCFGDDDGGRLFDATRNHAEHLLDPLATGAALYERQDLKAAAGELREETIWLLGRSGIERFDAVATSSPASASAALTESGVYVMDGATAQLPRILVCAGPFGAPRGGHGHADLLSVQLSVGKQVIVGDSGTFAYVSGDDARDRYRATGAHNTVEIDGHGQAASAGPFAWATLPEATTELWVTTHDFDVFCGRHAAFSNSGGPVEHCRWVFHLKPGFVLVRDSIAGAGSAAIDLRWHIAPTVELRPSGELADVAGEADRPLLAVIAAQDHGWCKTVDHGRASPVYGVEVRRPVIRFSTETRLPAAFATVFDPLTGSRRAGRLRKCGATGSAASRVDRYEYVTEDAIHRLFFAAAPGVWRESDWESDAGFLYCRMDPARRHIVELIAIGGSRVRHGEQVCSAPETPGDYWTWEDSVAANPPR